MKKIVPFKKDLLFKTKVSEITSISLEHKIISTSDDLVSGEFLINGEYKMTEGSINREKYDFNLPFDIALNSKYDISTLKVDIDNFDYEIVNNELLNVSIDLLIEADEKEEVREEKEEPKIIDNDREIELEKNIVKDNIINEDNSVVENNPIINEDNSVVENNPIINEENININNNINTNNLFNVEGNETYKTYYVYIVKEEDTIDKILDKYKITKEDLELYNDITNIKPLDKIIIPTNGK